MFKSKKLETETEIINYIKSKGTPPVPRNEYRSRVKDIVKAMKDNSKNVKILRIGCHSLSNIAMDIDSCELLVRNGILTYVTKILKQHTNDWRICWLACSFLWNVARTKVARDEIGINGVALIQTIIENHSHIALVMQTALGALSNLCIDNSIKQAIGTQSTILKEVNNLFKKHPYDSKVLTSVCGLITNLAYDEEIAKAMETDNVISNIVKCMEQHPMDNHLQRNASASLSNLSGTNNFIEYVCESLGIEALFKAIENHNSDDDVRQLATGALQNINVHSQTTSLHVASTFCSYENVKQILMLDWDRFMNIDEIDVYGETPLHAVMRALIIVGFSNDEKSTMAEKLDTLQFLIASGANLNATNEKNQTPLDLLLDTTELTNNSNNEENEERLKKCCLLAIEQGERHLKVVYQRLMDVICKARPQFPTDLSQVIASYCHPLELSTTFRVVHELTFKNAQHHENVYVMDCNDMMDVDDVEN